MLMLTLAHQLQGPLKKTAMGRAHGHPIHAHTHTHMPQAKGSAALHVSFREVLKLKRHAETDVSISGGCHSPAASSDSDLEGGLDVAQGCG